jgi:hypothetical protein
VNGQIYSYGYQPADSTGGTLLSPPFNTATGGNTDLRVLFIGYGPNSVFWRAIGFCGGAICGWLNGMGLWRALS